MTKYTKITVEELKEQSIKKETIHNPEDILFLTLCRKSLKHIEDRLKINNQEDNGEFVKTVFKKTLQVDKQSMLRVSSDADPVLKIYSTDIQIFTYSRKPEKCDVYVIIKTDVGNLVIHEWPSLELKEAVSISDRLGKVLENIYPVSHMRQWSNTSINTIYSF